MPMSASDTALSEVMDRSKPSLGSSNKASQVSKTRPQVVQVFVWAKCLCGKVHKGVLQ